jgi:hypothetical protein
MFPMPFNRNIIGQYVRFKMADKDFFPVIAHILGGDFNSYLNMNLREEHGRTVQVP